MQSNNKLQNIWTLLEEYFFIPFFGITTLVFLFFYITPLHLFYFSKTSAIYTSTISAFLIFFFWFKKLNKESKIKILLSELNKHVFISGIITIIILNLTIFKNLSSPENTGLILNFVIFFSGFITIYINKNLLINIESERNQEIILEQKEIIDFKKKFPDLSRIPLFKNIARFIYIEKWQYSLSVISLLIISFAIRLYNLGELGLWWDELLTGTYVTRILEVGLPLSPSNFEYYWRGISYHYLVSAFAFVFDNTEFWLRFPSTLFGVGIIIMSFIITKRFNKILALFTVIILSFSAYNIEYSQFARFYIMNAFLFLLNIEFFWRGFFEQRRIFKVLSFVTFFIMILTVQLGAIFIATILFYLLYKIFVTKITGARIQSLLKLEILAPLVLFLGIYLVGNPFDLIGIYTNHPYEVNILHQIDGNIKYLLPKIPYPEFKNIVIPFFNEFYWPSIFTIISFVVLLFLIIEKFRIKKELGYLEYFLSVYLISLIIFELANPFSKEPRLYFIFEPMYVISSILVIFLIIKEILKFKLGRIIISAFIITFVLLSMPQSNLLSILNIKYGDTVENDPFRSTWAQAYRSDSKTTLMYLREHIKDNDVWINTLEPGYFYLQKNPDYIFNQNYKWKNMWREEEFTDKNENYVEIRYNSILVNTVADLQKIINNNAGRDVWLLANGQNLETLYTKQLNKDFTDFLSENRDNIVYSSPDGKSKLLLFNRSN